MRTRKQTLIILGWNLLIVLVLISLVDIGARLFVRGRRIMPFDDPELFVSGRSCIMDHPTRGFTLERDDPNQLGRLQGSGAPRGISEHVPDPRHR
jgi:hypothetical protein